jgi:hypothetical protein
MSKTTLIGAAKILAIVAVAAAFQRHVMAIPVVGSYLPK